MLPISLALLVGGPAIALLLPTMYVREMKVTMYRVLLERAAEKDLSRLGSQVHDRVIAAIQALATNPRPPGCRKLVGSKNDWRIRVGDYRVLYEIADEIRVGLEHRHSLHLVRRSLDEGGFFSLRISNCGLPHRSDATFTRGNGIGAPGGIRTHDQLIKSQLIQIA